LRALTRAAAPRPDSALHLRWRPVPAAAPAELTAFTIVHVAPGGDVHAHLAEVLAILQRPEPLVLVTCGDLDGVPDPVTAAVWGLARTAQTEEPGRVPLIDVEERTDEAVALALGTGEPQTAVRDGQVLVPRLTRTAPAMLEPPAEGTWRL